MKLISKKLDKDQSGEITLRAEDAEDLWQCYNLLQNGDEISTKSSRRIPKLGKDGPIKGSSVRKYIRLRIKVEKTEFEANSSSDAASLRITGPVVEDTEFVSAGTYHSFELETLQTFTVFKPEWDAVAIRIVQESIDLEAKAEVAAVLLQDGLANIVLLTPNMRIVRAKVEVQIPKKRRGDATAHDKAVSRFYATVYETMQRNISLDKLRAVLLASPGFYARGLFDFIMDKATIDSNKLWIKSKSKFVLVHSSTGHVHALDEVLKDPGIQKQLSDTKYAQETLVMDEFLKLLNDEDKRAWYGPKQVEQAAAKSAVSQLLLSDSLFRSCNIAQRKRYIKLVDLVTEQHGQVFFFSSMHESGEQLDALTGVACKCSYSLDLDDSGDEET